MNKDVFIKSFIATFILLAITAGFLNLAFGIDLRGWWSLLITAIMFGVPTYFAIKHKDDEPGI